MKLGGCWVPTSRAQSMPEDTAHLVIFRKDPQEAPKESRRGWQHGANKLGRSQGDSSADAAVWTPGQRTAGPRGEARSPLHGPHLLPGSHGGQQAPKFGRGRRGRDSRCFSLSPRAPWGSRQLKSSPGGRGRLETPSLPTSDP